ncbi:MAG: hypothetical protein MHM6MM_000815 [Cercozoa sp. M6MM]
MSSFLQGVLGSDSDSSDDEQVQQQESHRKTPKEHENVGDYDEEDEEGARVGVVAGGRVAVATRKRPCLKCGEVGHSLRNCIYTMGDMDAKARQLASITGSSGDVWTCKKCSKSNPVWRQNCDYCAARRPTSTGATAPARRDEESQKEKGAVVELRRVDRRATKREIADVCIRAGDVVRDRVTDKPRVKISQDDDEGQVVLVTYIDTEMANRAVRKLKTTRLGGHSFSVSLQLQKKDDAGTASSASVSASETEKRVNESYTATETTSSSASVAEDPW